VTKDDLIGQLAKTINDFSDYSDWEIADQAYYRSMAAAQFSLIVEFVADWLAWSGPGDVWTRMRFAGRWRAVMTRGVALAGSGADQTGHGALRDDSQPTTVRILDASPGDV
jgi:hypothetical protein